MSGSGKSTVSRIIAEKTGLPLFHMDGLFWKGNWEAIPEDIYVESHKKLIEKDNWIIEGYIDDKMANRFERADLVLYLDYSRLLCFWRVILRWIQHRKESRPELPKEALETFSCNLLWTVLKRGERGCIESALNMVKPEYIVRVHSPKELDRFIGSEIK